MTETVRERFEERFTKGYGCWEWAAYRRPDGYGEFRIARPKQLAHRVSYQLYVGEIPAGMCVCHHCDNPPCVNPDHLFLGTDADNKRDCNDKGRRPSGEKNSSAKLTEEQVKEIRAMCTVGITQRVIAKEFGVSQSNISFIVLGKSWAKA